MKNCPFFKESIAFGNTCSARGKEEYVSSEYIQYCGFHVMSADYHKCPIYQGTNESSNSGGCYLTSACMSAKGNTFLDDCEELMILRGFRDTYVKTNYPEDIENYYYIAPKIVEKIELNSESKKIFNKLYDELVIPCCELIKNHKNYEAYNKYKKYSLALYEKYVV